MMKCLKKITTGLTVTLAISIMGGCESTRTPRGVVTSAGVALQTNDYLKWQSLFVDSELSAYASHDAYQAYRRLYFERGSKGISLKKRFLAEEKTGLNQYRRLYAVDVYDSHARRVLLSPLVSCDFYLKTSSYEYNPRCTALDHLTQRCLNPVFWSSECRIQAL